MYALHCHSKCHKRECIQHTLHNREATANRNSNKAWNLQIQVLSWFGIVDFFLLTILYFALMTHCSLINPHLSCTVFSHMPAQVKQQYCHFPPEKHIISQQQGERHCVTGTLTSYPVTWLVNIDLYQLVGADLELSRQLRRNVGRKGAVCWNTESPFAWVDGFIIQSLDFEKVTWKIFTVLIALGRRHHRKEHSADPVIK